MTDTGQQPAAATTKSVPVSSLVVDAKPAAAGQWSDDFLRALWRSQGGKFHGPNVETGTMPEAKLLPFLRMWLQEIATKQKQLREAEILNAERNRQNAAAFTENDRLRAALQEVAKHHAHGSDIGAFIRSALTPPVDNLPIGDLPSPPV